MVGTIFCASPYPLTEPPGEAAADRRTLFCHKEVNGAVRTNAPLVRMALVSRSMPRPRKPAGPFRYFNSSPEIIRLVVMMYVRFPLSLRNVENLLFERGIDISHETVRYWWNRFGPLFASDIRR